MILVKQIIQLILIGIYFVSLTLWIFIDYNLVDWLLIPFSIELSLKLIYLFFLQNLEKNKKIDLYWSSPYRSTSKWIQAGLFLVILILQLIVPDNSLGWLILLTLATSLLDKFFQILNWDFALEKDRIRFSSIWKKTIKYSEIQAAEIIEEGIEIKTQSPTKNLLLSKDDSELFKASLENLW